ncbi:MAG: SemiSWEET family transporter [Alphaproteobacteria bacterium]
MNKWYRRYMIFIGIFGQFLFYSQFYTILQHKSAHDVSLVGFIGGFISVFSWFIYGLMLNDKPLIISNIIASIGALLVVMAILIYQ